jgi:2-methylisocitrate lyase-like PEP mutase family enzyme
MHPRSSSVADSRQRLAERVATRKPTPVPVCLDPLSARIAEKLGYHAGYVSGGALGFSLAVSEALLTIDELSAATRAIVRRSDVPIIVDGGVCFGDPVHATRMVWEFEAAGAAAVEIEDQVAPKRVSHHRGIEHLIGADEMCSKVAAAAAARMDPDFLIIARTGAVRHEGIDAACNRAAAYSAAGADVILVPIPVTAEDITQIAGVVDVPIATFGFLGRPASEVLPGVGLYLDAMTPHVTVYEATKRLLQGHLEGATTFDFADLMAGYRELGEAAGFEGLYAIEDATTESGG